jgi:UDP-N-acetylglucosamine acyltransferase
MPSAKKTSTAPSTPAPALIHPTAIIDPLARLGKGVTIGPYAVLEGEVTLGEGCVVQSHAVITGKVTMGQKNHVGYGAIIGGWPQDFSFNPKVNSGVVIGDHNTFREYSTIHRGTAEGTFTVVGSGNFLMGGVHLGHNVKLGDNIVIANNCLLAGHVEVGNRAFLGGGSVFHQFMRIGEFAMVRGGCRFGQDIPPYLIATGENCVAGLNVVGLRRNNFTSEQRAELKAAFKLLYLSGLNVSQALEEAARRPWSAEGKAFFEFVAKAEKRGLCRVERKPPAAHNPGGNGHGSPARG